MANDISVIKLNPESNDADEENRRRSQQSSQQILNMLTASMPLDAFFASSVTIMNEQTRGPTDEGEIEGRVEEIVEPEEVDYKKMTVEQLKKVMIEKGLANRMTNKLKKSDIINILQTL